MSTLRFPDQCSLFVISTWEPGEDKFHQQKRWRQGRYFGLSVEEMIDDIFKLGRIYIRKRSIKLRAMDFTILTPTWYLHTNIWVDVNGQYSGEHIWKVVPCHVDTQWEPRNGKRRSN